MATVAELKDPLFHTFPIGVVVTLSHQECQQVEAGIQLVTLGVPEPYASIIKLANLALGALERGNGLDLHVILVPAPLVVPYPR